jgi:hypothetical protein
MERKNRSFMIKQIILAVSLVLASGSVLADHIWQSPNGTYYNNKGQPCDKDGNLIVKNKNSNKNSNVNKNTNNNTNRNTNINSSSSKSSSTSNATASSRSSSVATGGNAVANGGTANATGGAGGNVSVAGLGDNSNNTTIENAAAKIPVATAYSAGLVAGAFTCLGSASAGVQTQILGLTGGGTKIDPNCVRDNDVIMDINMGDHFHDVRFYSAACFRSREGKDGDSNDKALTAAGIDCKALAPPAAVVAPVPQNVVTREELNRAITKTLQK